MKRIAIVFCLLAGICPSAFGQLEMRRGGMPTTTYFVVASDAPGTMQRGGPNVFLCPATNPQVKIQEAIDTAAAAGGGLVDLSLGTFTVSKPSGAVDVVFTGDVAEGAGVSTVYNFTGMTAAEWAVTTIGQMFYSSGGQDASDDSCEDNTVDMISTVEKRSITHVLIASGAWNNTAKTITKTDAFADYTFASGDEIYVSGGTGVTAGFFTIASRTSDDVIVTSSDINGGSGDVADITTDDAVQLSEDFNDDYGSTAGGSGGKVTLVRMIPCIELKSRVYLKGSGFGGVNTAVTNIVLAADQNCTVMAWLPTSNSVGCGIADLSINGNATNQGDGAVTTYHPLCNGVITNEFGFDFHVWRANVMSCKGNGFWIGYPWGFHIRGGGWTEHHMGSGIVFGDGSMGEIVNHKVADNCLATSRDAHASNTAPGDGASNYTIATVRLQNADYCTITGGIFEGEQTWCIWAIDGESHKFVGCQIQSLISGGEGGIFLDGNLYSTMIGCVFNQNATGGPIGIDVNGYGHVIMGNIFDPAVVKPIELGQLTYAAQISGNVNAHVADDTKSLTNMRAEAGFTYLLNSTGGQIVSRRFVKRSVSSGTITVTTANTDLNVVGMTQLAIANSADGVVITHGYSPVGPIDDTAASNNGAVVIGDLLTPSDQGGQDGSLEEAASGDYVVAIAEEANAGALDGGVNLRAIYILPAGERYTLP